MSESSDSDTDVSVAEAEKEFQSSIDKADLNSVLQILQQPPIKLHGVRSRRRPQCGKQKVAEIHSCLKRKMASALSIEPLSDITESSSQDIDETSQNSADLKNLVQNIIDKLSENCDRARKLQILTIAPSSWSKGKVMETFNVSEAMVRSARKLLKEKGILALPARRKGKVIPEGTIHKVRLHYEDDEFSRLMSGKKDKVSVARKVYKQKRLLLCTLQELYVELKKRYPALILGYSKFCSLRPSGASCPVDVALR